MTEQLINAVAMPPEASTAASLQQVEAGYGVSLTDISAFQQSLSSASARVEAGQGVAGRSAAHVERSRDTRWQRQSVLVAEGIAARVGLYSVRYANVWPRRFVVIQAWKSGRSLSDRSGHQAWLRGTDLRNPPELSILF